MKINTRIIGWLFIVWAAMLLLGLAVGLNWPFVLLLIGTIIVLVV
jgi:hypothetical protein